MEFSALLFSKPSIDYQANFIVLQLPANRKRDLCPNSANKIPRALFATPFIELKKRILIVSISRHNHFGKQLRAARGCQSPDRDSGDRKVGEKTIYVI